MKEEAARAAEADRERDIEKYKEGVRYQQELERQLEVRKLHVETFYSSLVAFRKKRPVHLRQCFF